MTSKSKPAGKVAAAKSAAPAKNGHASKSVPVGAGERGFAWTPEAHARATGLLQILGPDGALVRGATAPALGKAELLRLYEGMLRIRVMDERLLGLQRQGRVGFYGEAKGQEASVIGAAAAIGPEDYFVPALREAGAALYRGLPMRAYVAQILGNGNDLTKGRQMPCHPGSRATRYVTMSSCIATQLPHTTGIAWAAKMKGEKIVALGFMGDGATSEGDFHVALNFAAVYRVPAVFVCQNNQWAISTPGRVQTVADSIALKAAGLGMPGVRVDGNDVLAVYTAVKEAVDRAREGGGPTLIETLTYRMGAHSSSDDPSRYRDENVTVAWKAKDPLARFRTWLIAEKVLTEKADEKLRADLDAEVRDAVVEEEKAGPPPLASLIDDVFAEPTPRLREQLADLERVRAERGPVAGGHGAH